MKPSVLMVVVHYGNSRVTVRLISSLEKLRHLDRLEVLVVNNGLDEDLKSRLDQCNSNALRLHYVVPACNKGYFGGAVHGVDYYRENFRYLPDWLIISNSDVAVSDELFLEKLLRINPSTIGAIAPRIVSQKTLTDQNPFMRRRPTSWRIVKWRFWLSNYKLARFRERLAAYKRLIWGRLNAARPEPRMGRRQREFIYAPHGSFIILSRRYLDLGGSLDHGAFLYGEELTIGENCRRIGLPVMYDPELVVLHDEHSAIGQRFSRASYERHREAFEYFTRSHFAELS